MMNDRTFTVLMTALGLILIAFSSLSLRAYLNDERYKEMQKTETAEIKKRIADLEDRIAKLEVKAGQTWELMERHQGLLQRQGNINESLLTITDQLRKGL